MGKAIKMEDLEAINFPYYYNLVKEGKIKRLEVVDLLFKGNGMKYNRYKRVMEGKQAISQESLERHKEYYKANSEKNKERSKQRYENNKEYYKRIHKEYHEANKEKIKRRNHGRYRELMETPEGREYYKAKSHKRRAKIKGNGGSYTSEEWNKCLAYFDYKDAYTGEPLTTTEVEHVIPISKGGTNNIYNIVPANRSTNASKHNSDPWEWYSQQPYFSWNRYIKICMWIIKMGEATK